MAMLISRFNKLIRSRILWGVFLVIIVFSFVVWGTFSGGSREETARSPGRMYGKDIPAAEFHQAYQAVLAEWVFAMGRRPDITDRMDRAIRQNVWRRLASLEEARRMGLSATDDEVWAAVEASFSTDGQFNEAAWRDFVERRLPELGYSKAFFDRYMRDEVLLGRLRAIVDSVLLVPPADVQRNFSAWRDEFTAEYVEIPRSLAETNVAVTDDQLRTEFETRAEDYRLPPRVRVKYVLFKVEDFPVEPASIRDDEAEDYYAENTHRYRVLVPDEPSPEAVSTNGAAAAAEPRMREKTRPFEEVRDEVRAELAREASRNRAREAADAFISRLLPERATPMSFDDAAAAAQVEIQRPEPLAARDVVPGVALPAFNRAAFELRDNPDEYFSNPVTSDRGVYVIALDERLPSRLPTYEEAADRLRESVHARAVKEALYAKARELRTAVADRGRPLAEVAAEWGLTARTSPAFTADDGVPNEPLSSLIVQAVLSCNEGELSEPMPSPAGGLVLARVVRRVPGDAATLASLKTDIVQIVHRMRAPVLQASFQDWLLERAAFEAPERPPAETDDAGPEEDGAESDEDADV